MSPVVSYQPTPLPRVPGHHIESITYTVPSISRDGEVHTISQDVVDGRLRCDCPARKQCWAEKAVIAGLVKPRIRICPRPAPASQRPPRPAPRLEALPVDDLYSDGGAGVARSLQAVAS